MLVGGLWHGAGWTFILWGALHGLYLIVNHTWHKLWTHPLNRWWSILIARLITLLAIMIGWVFFRAESFDGAIIILQGMVNLPHTITGHYSQLASLLSSIGFTFNSPGLSLSNIHSLMWAFSWLVVIWGVSNTQQLLIQYEPAYSFNKQKDKAAYLQHLMPSLYWRPTLIWAIWISIISVASLLSLSRVSEFLYFQF